MADDDDVYEVNHDGAFDLSEPPPPVLRQRRARPTFGAAAPVTRATMTKSTSRGMITNFMMLLAAFAYTWGHEAVAFVIGALILLPRLIDRMMEPVR